MLVDNFAIGIFILFILIGYRKGVITEFISFSALLFNIVLSKELTPYIVEHLNITLTNKFYDIFVYVGVFIFTYVVFSLIIRFMLRTIRGQKKLFIDRVTGALLGFIKALLILVLVLLVLSVVSKFSPKIEKQLVESKIYALSGKFTESTAVFLPGEIKEMLEKYEYDNEIEKAIKKSLGGKTNEKN